MTDEALKPCPFCGSRAEAVEQNNTWFISCTFCFCNVGECFDGFYTPDHMFKSEAEALDAWNTRAENALVRTLIQASEGLKRDMLNRAEWDDDAKVVCAGTSAWLRFTTALAALQETGQ